LSEVHGRAEHQAIGCNMAVIQVDANELDSVIRQAVEAAIRRLSAQRPKDVDGRVLLTKQEAAESLGVSVATVDRLRAKRGLPSVSLDGRVLFRPATLEAWAAQNESS